MITTRLLLPTFAALGLMGACYAPRSTKLATPTPKEKAPPAQLGDAQSGYHLVMGSKTIDGAIVAPEARPTALVVFASWCGPCRGELAALGEIRERFPTLRVIGLNAYEDYGERSDEVRLRTFLDANAPWLTQIVHADPALLRGFGNVPKIPTLFIYDESGEVVAEFRRNKRKPPSHEELEEAIASAVAGSAKD